MRGGGPAPHDAQTPALGAAPPERAPGAGRLVVSATHEESSRRAAELFAEAASRAPREGRLALVLSGGSGPRRLLELLAEGHPEPLPWARVHVFWSDERCVPPDDPESNYRLARALLLDHVPVASERVHRMRGEDPPERAAAGYRVELERLFGSGPPAFDVALLGLGRDAHTCSLFPGDPALASARTVEATRSPEGVRERITLTPAAFRRTARVVFLVSGPEKAAAVARMLSEDAPATELPARAIRPHSGETVWLLDGAAAALLDRAR